VKFGICDPNVVLLRICGFHRDQRKKKQHYYRGHKWNYISTCTIKTYGILKVKKAFSISVYYIIEYTICSFLFVQGFRQSVCLFYFLNIFVHMENEKAVLSFIYIASVIKKSPDRRPFWWINVSWTVQKERQYIKTKHFLCIILSFYFLSSIYLPFPLLFIFLPLSYSSLTLLTASLFIFVILVILHLLSCYCD